MGTVSNALTWSGSGADLSMFVVFPNSATGLDFGALVTSEIQVFELVDDQGVSLDPEYRLTEFSFKFESLPANLDEVVAGCLENAMAAGAAVAWFGFDGSFHFDYLLAKEIASQIYAVADSSGLDLALDDGTIESSAWLDRVARARRMIPIT